MSASKLITKRIAELGDWRGKTLSRMRKLIKEADPNIVEEWKWMGTPVFSHDGAQYRLLQFSRTRASGARRDRNAGVQMPNTCAECGAGTSLAMDAEWLGSSLSMTIPRRYEP